MGDEERAAAKQEQTTSYRLLTVRLHACQKLINHAEWDHDVLKNEHDLLLASMDHATDAHYAYKAFIEDTASADVLDAEDANFSRRMKEARNAKDAVQHLQRVSQSPDVKPSLQLPLVVGSQPTDSPASFSGPRASTLNTYAAPYLDMSRLLEVIAMPSPVIEKFGGDVMQYRQFTAAFDARVASRTSSDRDKLFYLDQHLIGEPKTLINSCFYLGDDDGYPAARALLDSEYGDPYKAAMTFLSQLNMWPVIMVDDCIALRDYSLFLTRCQCAMMSLSQLHVLNQPSSLQTVVLKLPQFLQNKWRDKVHGIQSENRYPQFADLVTFVKVASSSANDPVFGITALTFSAQLTGASKGGQLPTNPSAQGNSCWCNRVDVRAVNQVSCYLCERSHDIEQCSEYMGKTTGERRQFVIANNLCFGCLFQGHLSRTCKKRRKCRVCGKMHPTSLHVDSPPPASQNHQIQGPAPNGRYSNETVDARTAAAGAAVLHVGRISADGIGLEEKATPHSMRVFGRGFREEELLPDRRGPSVEDSRLMRAVESGATISDGYCVVLFLVFCCTILLYFVFTCMASRAVHLEIASSLDSDSCINAIRRFIARRGAALALYSDNGTNFTAADRELKKAVQDIDHSVMQSKLLHLGIKRKFNPPLTSHFGGTWERSIRTVLSGLLIEYGEQAVARIEDVEADDAGNVRAARARTADRGTFSQAS